jgi:ferric iron reductase protein FhuF
MVNRQIRRDQQRPTKRRNNMKRLISMFALIALMVLPVMVTASTKADTTPPQDKQMQDKQKSAQPAPMPAETGQRRRVQTTSEATDATTARDMSEALKQSISQYNDVNPSVND